MMAPTPLTIATPTIESSYVSLQSQNPHEVNRETGRAARAAKKSKRLSIDSHSISSRLKPNDTTVSDELIAQKG